MTASAVTIYLNPNCETSRNVLAHIRKAGIEPTVIEYLKTPATRAELVALLKRMNISARALLREKEPAAKTVGGSDDEILDAMMNNPILINRPIVVTPRAVKLCRPSETVLDILPPSA